jgi:hypothetical protein
MKMMTIFRRTIFFGFFALAIGCCVLLVEVTFHRYPSKDEIRVHFSRLPEMNVIAINDRQGDIGYFGLTRQLPSGTEEFFIETYPQWIWIGQSYDWSEAGY